MRLKRNLLKLIVGIMVFWFLAHTVYIIIDGLSDKNNKADVAIVLGNKVNADGTLSERLKQRLDQSIVLYKQNRVPKIIVSGGLGKEGFWEATVMKEYLVENQIPANEVIVDNYGNDTEKTVINSIHIMDSLHLKSVITVSQYFHQTRTKKLFKNKGVESIESSSPTYFEFRDFYSIFREFVAFYKEAL